MQAQNGKKKEKKSENGKSHKKSSKKAEKKKAEEKDDDYELYSHESTTSPSSASTLEVKDDLRKALEEKSKKYAHLPVYDRATELKKAKEREAKMSAILSDMDRNLGAVSNLTSSHMESKGVTMVSTPFDDDSSSQERKESAIDIHTIKYEKATLESRETSAKQSVSEPQGDKSSTDTENIKISKFTKEETIHSESIKVNQKLLSGDSKLSNASLNESTKEELPVENKTKHDNSENIPKENGITENFREKSKQLDTKGKNAMSGLNVDQEIPFADDPEEGEDFTSNARTSNEDDEICEALSALPLDPNLKVEKIQLEVNPEIVKENL